MHIPLRQVRKFFKQPGHVMALVVALATLGSLAIPTSSTQAFQTANTTYPIFLACNQPILNGNHSGALRNSQYVGCWFKASHPNPQPIPDSDKWPILEQFGIHFPITFPGVAAYSSATHACNQDSLNGHNRLSCFGKTAPGTQSQVDFTLHVSGDCGQVFPMNAVVANYDNSIGGPIWFDLKFPDCPVATATPTPTPTATATPTPTATPRPQCSDGVDNDGDNRIDANDPGCHFDGKANNPNSYDPNDTTEYDNVPQCRDGIDNDWDGYIDFPADPGCTSENDDSEAPNPTPTPTATPYPSPTPTPYPSVTPTPYPKPQCSDGIDNDYDGWTDYPADPGCKSRRDNSEHPNPTPYPTPTVTPTPTYTPTPTPYPSPTPTSTPYPTHTPTPTPYPSPTPTYRPSPTPTHHPYPSPKPWPTPWSWNPWPSPTPWNWNSGWGW